MKVQTFLADLAIGDKLPARAMVLSLREEGGATLQLIMSEDQAQDAAIKVGTAVSTKEMPALQDLELSGGPERAGHFLTARDLFEDARGNQADRTDLFVTRFEARILNGALLISGRQENGNEFNADFDAFAAHALVVAVDDCFGK